MNYVWGVDEFYIGYQESNMTLPIFYIIKFIHIAMMTL